MDSRPPYSVTIARVDEVAIILDLRCRETHHLVLGSAALRLGPQEYLLIATDSAALAAARRDWPEAVIATDVSAMYVRYRLEGDDAIAVLAQGIAIDLEKLPVGFATRTLLARATAILVHRQRAFELLIERSYTRYVEHWLAAASGRSIQASA